MTFAKLPNDDFINMDNIALLRIFKGTGEYKISVLFVDLKGDVLYRHVVGSREAAVNFIKEYVWPISER
jgi:hypothetical protein